jgi:AcrR family transcriptional regulator
VASGDGGSARVQKSRRSSTRGRTRLSSPQSEKMLRKLLAGGRQVLRTVGYHNATVEDIVQAAGVSRATFYLYFDEKADFLRAMVVDTLVASSERTIAPPSYAQGNEGLGRVREWLDHAGESFDEHAAVWQAWSHEYVNDPVLLLLAAARQKAEARFAEVVSESPAAGRMSPQVAAAVFRAIQTNAFAFLIPLDDGSRPRDLDTVARFVYQGVYGGSLPEG